MREAILILAIVGGVLAAPVLCTAGVTEHECVCADTDCCDKEVICEQDPCDDAYQRENGRRQDLGTTIAAALPLAGVADTTVGHDYCALPAKPPSRNLPFPDSDLPLRI